MAWRAPPPAEKVMAGTRPRIQLRPAGGARPPHRHHAPPPPAAAPSAAAPPDPPASSAALALPFLLLKLLLAARLLLPNFPAYPCIAKSIPPVAVDAADSASASVPLPIFLFLSPSPLSPAPFLLLEVDSPLHLSPSSPRPHLPLLLILRAIHPLLRPFDSQLHPCMLISRFLLLVFGIRGDSIKPEPEREREKKKTFRLLVL